jgi:hypothetical protein
LFRVWPIILSVATAALTATGVLAGIEARSR